MPLYSAEVHGFDSEDSVIDSRIAPSKREQTITDSDVQLSESERPTPMSRQKQYDTKYFCLTVPIKTEISDQLPP